MSTKTVHIKVFQLSTEVYGCFSALCERILFVMQLHDGYAEGPDVCAAVILVTHQALGGHVHVTACMCVGMCMRA